MHGLDDRRFSSGGDMSIWVAVGMAALVIGGSLLLSVRRLRTMDVP
jgi:hypothetical protein